MSPAFGVLVLAAAVAGVVAVLSSRVSERLRIPAPAFFLIAAAAASAIWPQLGNPSSASVEHVVSIALAVILFDGGMRLGWRRLQPARPGHGPARIPTGPPSRLRPVSGRAWWTQGRCTRCTEVHDGDAGPGPSRRA